MGMKDEGFGTNPVDINRQFMTADFYRKFGRKMPQSQEAQDSMAAVNYLISQGAAGDITNVSQVKGLERAEAIQRQREFAASKLETLRNRGTKVVLPLPSTDFFCEPLLRQVYGSRKAGDTTYFTTEDSQTLTNTQAVVAMNQLLAKDVSGRVYVAAHEYLKNFKIYRNALPSPEIFEIMRGLVTELTSGQTISLPFVGKTLSFGADSGNVMELAKCLEAIKTLKASTEGARQAAKAYAELTDRMLENPRGAGPPPPEATRLAVGSTAIAELIPPARPTRQSGFMNILAGLQQPAPAAPPEAPAAAPARTQRPPNVTAFIRLGAAGRRALLTEYGLPYEGNSKNQYDALMAI
jgi:hypothetical protein